MARKYTGNSDGVSKTGKRPGVQRFAELCNHRFGATNLGTFVNRAMRSDPKQLSVHATGRAIDVKFKEADKKAFLDAMIAHADDFELEEFHDYAYKDPKQDKAWGRGWRCNRNGKAGWKVWNAKENGGTPGAEWFHLEFSPKAADDPELIVAAWHKAFPKA